MADDGGHSGNGGAGASATQAFCQHDADRPFGDIECGNQRARGQPGGPQHVGRPEVAASNSSKVLGAPAAGQEQCEGDGPDEIRGRNDQGHIRRARANAV
jgi:hypothetical protein